MSHLAPPRAARLAPLLVGLLVGLLLTPSAAGAQEADAAGVEPELLDASGRLQQAILSFQRGDLGAAADGFDAVLDYPVQVQARQELHEGFLHWSYTLFLQGSKIQAAEKLRIALRLRPDYQPSPVVLRPDLYAFYQEARAAFFAGAPGRAREAEELAVVFPELQARAGQDGEFPPFVPVFGIGLTKLGHASEGMAFGIVEVAALVTNRISLAMRLDVSDKLSPTHDAIYAFSLPLNFISAGVFWTVLVAEVIRTLTLQRRYTEQPELRPRLVAPPGRIRAPPPVVRLGAEGLTVAFW